MKNKIYIIGNWKMNPVSFDEARRILGGIEDGIKDSYKDLVEIVVCPPSIYLCGMNPGKKVKLGTQNIFWEEEGAFTGEISAKMLKNFGVEFAIIGHSERRKYIAETDKMINSKIISAVGCGITPILCVGETLEERKKGETGDVIIRQLCKALENLEEKQIVGKLIVAYEPIWAIGSGNTPSWDEIMSVGLLIKKTLSKIYGNRLVADNAIILYGGSVNQENSFDIVNKTGMDGILVGGASIQISNFLGIIDSFVK